MGIFRTALAVTGWGTFAAAGTFVALTRKSRVTPIEASDYIFNHTQFARLNPNNSPVTQDVCTRQVPLASIRPELLEKEGKLAEAFCAGVWSGIGYAYQRRYLEKKWRGPETEGQLWSREELGKSTYDVGTLITDHFEVVSKTPESIIVRCGDSPRIKEARDSDGLFEMFARVKEEEGVAEFGLKSVFFNSKSGYLAAEKTGPMPPHIQWLHGLYDKVWMESAVRNVTN